MLNLQCRLHPGMYTALHIAAEAGNKGAVKAILATGKADRGIMSDDGRTAAQEAECNGFEDIARIIRGEKSEFEHEDDDDGFVSRRC